MCFILSLHQGLEEANQSLNKNREHEDEEERMAADAEKRKRMLLNGRSLSADSTMSRRMKILMLGDSGVGKSSLILRWTMDTFSPSLVSTVGVNFKTRKVTLLGESTQVQVWDTAGQEHFHKITTSYYRGANGIMLVYDVSDQKTFDNVHYWIKNIKSHASSSVEIVLVGNKSDLRGSDEVSGPCVEACQGKELAETFGISFFETSAKESHNVDDAFMKLAGNIAAAMAPAFPVHGSGLSASTSASELNGRYGAASASGSASAASQHSLEHKNAADDASDKPAKLGKSGRLFGFGKSKKNKDYRKSPLPSHESGYSGHSNSSNSQSNAGGSSKLRSLGKSKTRAVDGGDDDDRDESDSDREKCIIS